jgi:hypothetical protein
VYRFRNGIGHFKVKNPKGNNIKCRSPNYCLKWSQHFGRNNGSNRVGGIMKPIDQVKYDCQRNN